MPIDTDNDLPGFAPLPQVAESDMSGDRIVDPDDNSEGGEQPIFRPHPFALVKGVGGAGVAYGQFFWKVDAITLNYNEVLSEFHNNQSGQDVIDGWTAVVPTVDDASGNYLVSNEQNSFDQLSGWGNVYLYWTVDLDEADNDGPITSCYVSTSTPTVFDIIALPSANTASDRLSGTGGSENNGTYSVLLGTVPESGQITQHTASDIFWPMFVLKRSVS
jgi:hypothetical protein